MIDLVAKSYESSDSLKAGTSLQAKCMSESLWMVEVDPDSNETILWIVEVGLCVAEVDLDSNKVRLQIIEACLGSNENRLESADAGLIKIENEELLNFNLEDSKTTRGCLC